MPTIERDVNRTLPCSCTTHYIINGIPQERFHTINCPAYYRSAVILLMKMHKISTLQEVLDIVYAFACEKCMAPIDEVIAQKIFKEKEAV